MGRQKSATKPLRNDIVSKANLSPRNQFLCDCCLSNPEPDSTE